LEKYIKGSYYLLIKSMACWLKETFTGVIRTAHGRIILHHTWKKQALQYKYITSRERLQRSELGFTTLSRKQT
jgi:hypothetical protein